MSGLNYKKNGKIGIITISRPEVLNSMNTVTINEMKNLFNEIDEDKEIRCVILTGEGRAFCAGGDINEEAKTTVLTGYQFSRNCGQLLEQIERFRTPVIAAINGYALGGGLEFTLACDIRIASENAILGSPEITLAVIPGWGGTQRLPRTIGISKAKQMIFTGEQVSAPEAYRIGLVDEVVQKDKLMEKAMEMATKIAHYAPIAMNYSKIAIYDGMQCDLQRGLQIEAALFGHLYCTEDQHEAMTAFLEKRKVTEFKGK